ncbi:hypothetical protein ACIGEZ_28790 [Streptomyces sp. NPDC085481]|uniref:hypothetical protein n=1 Tax=Streptomyces sp. NPDC085481 TaxID=3365727 RepID=UPI0037D51EE4
MATPSDRVPGLWTGAFRPAVHRTFPLEEIAEERRYLEAGARVDKIVVTVAHGPDTA